MVSCLSKAGDWAMIFSVFIMKLASEWIKQPKWMIFGI